MRLCILLPSNAFGCSDGRDFVFPLTASGCLDRQEAAPEGAEGIRGVGAAAPHGGFRCSPLAVSHSFMAARQFGRLRCVGGWRAPRANTPLNRTAGNGRRSPPTAPRRGRLATR